MKSDEKTFSEIVRQFERPLYLYIRRLVVSHEDAADILQETFIKAFRKLWTLHDSSAVKPWLYRIATNESLSFLRHRRDSVSLDAEFANLIATSDNVNYDAAEIKLQKALLRLPEKQRLAFSLKYYEDMDYDQMEKVTGVRAATMKVNYHYAKEKLEYEINNL